MTTNYARLSPLQARTALTIAVLGTLFCLTVAVSPLWQGKADEKRTVPSDVALYQAEVERIHNGETYYQAASAELTARGFPTRSVFNWRMPLPMWLIGKLPSINWAKCILVTLSLCLVILAFEVVSRDNDRSFGMALSTVLMLSGPLLFSLLDNLLVMPVLWAGILIALSATSYGVGRSTIGFLFGLSALFFRELALPYCMLCIALAFFQKRHKELFYWSVGLSAWMLFFAWHYWQVSMLIRPDAITQPQGWIRFGGAGFVLATAQMNAYLLLLPPWCTALFFSAAMIGFAGWHTDFGTRIGLTTCLYILAFACVGKDVNQYWGSLIAPLLCFGVVRMPVAIRDIVTKAFMAHPEYQKT